MAGGIPPSQMLLDSEESKNIAVVHKTNQGYSGKDLWKLKQERPELFGVAAAADAAAAQGRPPAPPGFVEDPRLGADWLYSRDRDTFMHRNTRKLYVRDVMTNELVEMGHGRDFTGVLSVHGDAAASVKPSGPASRHVIINDLHRAAASMKLDFAHHDSPAAMFAIYDGQSSGTMAEAAAKSLHVRLLPRLAQHRGDWENERLEAVVADTIKNLAVELGAEAGVSLAVALLLGSRLTLAATGGAMCLLFGRDSGGEGGMDDVDVAGPAPGSLEVEGHCAVLEDSHLGVLLAVDSVRRAQGLSASRLRALVRGHVSAERPRAACITVLGEAVRSGAEPPLVAAAVRFGWTRQDVDVPAPKRPRAEASCMMACLSWLMVLAKASRLTKVRCRHILLRHASCTSQLDRGKPKPTRTSGEAEEMLLRLLPELALGGAGAFTARCKKDSDCDTALRGGDLAGDLGWLDRDPAKNRKVPASVVRAAFTLAVGQLSDIVSSERGVHLLLRTA